MQFVAASLASVMWIGAHSTECYETLYSADAVDPSTGNVLAEIAISDEMHFEMDITPNSFPTGWASVFHCGSTNNIRQPGIWLHPDSDDDGATWEGFHISYSHASSTNPYINPGPHLVAGQTYHFELDITQSSLVITIDGTVQYEDMAYTSHTTYDSQPCYSGDPWYEAADVEIANLVISTPGECSVDCSALDIDEFLDTCSSNYEDLVAQVGASEESIAANTANIATNTGSISSNADGIATNAAAITALDARIDSLVITDGENATPGLAYHALDNKDLLIIGLLVVNLAVIVMSVYVCVYHKAPKYQPVKAYSSE